MHTHLCDLSLLLYNGEVSDQIWRSADNVLLPAG